MAEKYSGNKCTLFLSLTPWVLEVIACWDMPFFAQIPRYLAICAFLSAVLLLLSNNKKCINICLKYLIFYLVIAAVILVLVLVFFQYDVVIPTVLGVLFFLYDILFLLVIKKRIIE